MMSCTRFASARVLEAYGEPAGAEGERHLALCERCRTEVEEFLEVRRIYRDAAARPLHARVKGRIMSNVRRERTRGRVRSAIASMAGLAAAILVFAGVGNGPTVGTAAATVPTASEVDGGLAEVRTRVADLELGDPGVFDAALEDLRGRVHDLNWDDENM